MLTEGEGYESFSIVSMLSGKGNLLGPSKGVWELNLSGGRHQPAKLYASFLLLLEAWGQKQRHRMDKLFKSWEPF